jgi:hypothetical protein
LVINRKNIFIPAAYAAPAEQEEEDLKIIDEASCFTAGTKVLMADGTEKNIENVKIGDVLLGSDNSHNTVRGYDQPTLGDRLLYSINGGDYFVTVEHPFMTTEGWKSISPEATHREMPGFELESLSVGDILITATGSVKILSIQEQAGDSKQQLYNFILDGNNTYYANGYLVHNKSMAEVCDYYNSF